jgi:uncharacterized protein (DUF427 family)
LRNFNGQARPPFAVIPRDGQESVWDYPRPPALLTDSRLVTVRAEGLVIAESDHSYRVCETASPPTFYLSPSHVDWSLLTHVEVSSYCEWKGTAAYWGLVSDPDKLPVGWSYRRPRAKFSKLKNHICFYPERVECYVDGERVRPQPGPFYGGWISDDVVGPFKGGPGTGHW